MARLRMNNKQWQRIRPMIPDGKPGGRPPIDRRTILDGILWILRTGAPWRDLPKELWCIDGTVIRAQRCASGGGKKGTLKSQRTMH